VRSKLSGARQVLAVATGNYSRPIETPVRNLRPARETCEQCHWPDKFHGDRLNVLRHYESDEANTETFNVLLLKIGGGEHEGRSRGGIHWHTHPESRVVYVASDHSREEIPYVRLERPDGEVVEWVTDGYEGLDELLATGEERVMDCIDCHNRPTHIYHLPSDAVDDAMAHDRLDRSVPYLKREALKALTETEIAAGEDPYERIRTALAESYGSGRLAGRASEAALDAAALELADIWAHNVFPEMNITWGTYPNHLGHPEDEGGCFRCHDGEHVSESGEIIENSCDNCHGLLAWEEEDPEILSLIFDE
jgi:hypothetical protein